MATKVRTRYIDDKHENKLIQHLGIVAGICDESHLAERIDALVEQSRRKVSVGQAVQAMILNALGLSGRALYLTKRFYTSRPVDLLIGEGIRADDLHDSSLGTALDAIYDRGITELFSSVAGSILAQYGVPTRFVHLDSTTFSLHGVYNSEEDEEVIPKGVIHITKGYSKDSAPGQNQVVLQLICTHRSSMPMWVEALSGNTVDKKSFAKTVKAFQQQFYRSSMPYVVMDAAFYTQTNLQSCDDVRWVTRVPETLSEVKRLYDEIETEQMMSLSPGYRNLSVDNHYAGVPQRC